MELLETEDDIDDIFEEDLVEIEPIPSSEEMEVAEYGIKHIKEDNDIVFHDILKEEIVKEEPTDIEPPSKYDVCDENHLDQEQESRIEQEHIIQDGKFHNLESTELVEFPTSAEKDTVESKPDLTDFWDTFHKENSKCTNYEKTKPEFKHFPDEVEIKNEIEDHNEISSDLLRDTDEFKTDTPKTEDGIDIIHGDVKPESFEEVSIKIEPSTSTELSTDGGIGLQHDAALKEGKGSRQDCGNYRPIALLSQFAKMMEEGFMLP
ncbi:hypothetical protein JTB14_032711 [Gonioctena quinquepunctata]|nr:hypothetical protein JTB14_032711 [Gonioctena quinquepunctata]